MIKPTWMLKEIKVINVLSAQVAYITLMLLSIGFNFLISFRIRFRNIHKRCFCSLELIFKEESVFSKGQAAALACFMYTQQKIMAIEMRDGHITGSSGVAKAGLTLGIIGTGLAALGGNAWGGNCGNGGILGGLLNNNNGNCRAEAQQSEIANLEAQVAELKSMRYTDYVGIDLYKNIVATQKEEDKKISDLQGTLFAYIIDIDKRTALNDQAAKLNREYDTAARDYMFTILNNKIDCCCEKVGMQMNFNKQLTELSDASVLAYVNSTFLPGTLKLPITSICPQPATATTAA